MEETEDMIQRCLQLRGHNLALSSLCAIFAAGQNVHFCYREAFPCEPNNLMVQLQ